MFRRQTRRAFLRHAGQLSAATATLAAFGLRPTSGRAFASEPAESVEVLLADVLHPWLQITTASSGAIPGWHYSPVVRSDFAFTHVGLHWRGSEACRPELRTSPDGVSWSGWKSTTVESRRGENPKDECFATLLGAERERFAQYRLPTAGPAVEAASLTFLNSVDGPRRQLPATSALQTSLVAGTQEKGVDFRTDVISREAWGADESLRFAESGAEEWERLYVAPRIVVVHHTATRNRPSDPAADVRAIYAFHAVTQGWGDIGYNALIDHEGLVRQEPPAVHEILVHQGRAAAFERDVPRFAADAEALLVHAPVVPHPNDTQTAAGQFQHRWPSDFVGCPMNGDKWRNWRLREPITG